MMPGEKVNTRSDGFGKLDTVTPDHVRALRLQAQHLHPKASAKDLAGVVRSLVGVNAQSGPAMMLSLRGRVKGLEMTDVKDAIAQKRLVRTWTMRGTIHLIDSPDLGWMISLLGPAIIAKGRRRRLELGLDEDILERCLDEIPAILHGREPLTREELTEGLIGRGIPVERKGQAPYHLIAYAALKGLICIGPDNPGGEQTYYLVSELAGKQKDMTGDEALAELVIRYLRGYGPASPQDFSAWSGLSLTDAKKGWKLAMDREVLREISVEDCVLWSLESQYVSPERPLHTGTVVNLLPAFDSLVLGYADREYLVPDRYRKEIYHGGQTVPVVLVDGLAAGVWRYERRGKKLNINVTLFKPGDRAIKDLVREEAEDIGRFFGLQTSMAFHA